MTCFVLAQMCNLLNEKVSPLFPLKTVEIKTAPSCGQLCTLHCSLSQKGKISDEKLLVYFKTIKICQKMDCQKIGTPVSSTVAQQSLSSRRYKMEPVSKLNGTLSLSLTFWQKWIFLVWELHWEVVLEWYSTICYSLAERKWNNVRLYKVSEIFSHILWTPCHR